ncbi:hypothetical protein [Kineosporia babensis]|uniref:Uncharacterized protein n=1 Tax=Kineosporia babensis TaxID=499548 RepID=A0A9X1NK94_9ACTN|nr:hypothetical protein [Kineosporia babensis]MCD5315314.1 hypothetical protein [Kineosporia babensis]
MAFFIVLLLLTATIALAPWLGQDSRELDPDRFVPTHPLHEGRGMNCG